MAEWYLLPLYENYLDRRYCLNCQEWVFPRTPISYKYFLFVIVMTAIFVAIATIDTGEPLVGQIVVGLLSGIVVGTILSLGLFITYHSYVKEPVCPTCNARNFEQHVNRHRTETGADHRQRRDDSEEWNWNGQDGDDS